MGKRLEFRIMDQQWIVSAWVLLASAAALIVLAVWAVVALARSRARTTAALALARADADALKAQVEEIERRLKGPAPAPDEREYVITRLGNVPETHSPESETESAPTPRIAGQLFADLVLRESVVQAASLAAGLRRALAPQVRSRIRFEMRREVKRARKQRKADLRVARREWEARQRSQMDVDDLANGSAA